MSSVKVELIPPTGLYRAFKRTAYRLLEDVQVGGITVPAGFITDFASLPPIVRGLFDPLGEWAKPALAHDWRLENGFSRQEAAHEFREDMKDQGVTPAVRQVFYWAVRTWDFFRGDHK